MNPHVIVVDDKSSMWGPEVRVFGPYPSRTDALKDETRIAGLYPRRNFIVIVELQPGEFTTTPAPPKGKARKKLVVDCDIQGVPAEKINRMVQS